MSIKVIPPWMSFEQALRLGHVGRMECEGYTKWVKSLPCVASQMPADDPHHPVNVGFKGTGTKVPDFWCIPLTREQHDLLHHSVATWEDKNGEQMHHALMTLTRAIYEGKLVWKG